MFAAHVAALASATAPILCRPACVAYRAPPPQLRVSVREAEETFVEDGENLEDGETLVKALKAFDEADGAFLGAGALIRRRSETRRSGSFVHDVWIRDSLEANVGPNRQVRGAQMILDQLFLLHLQTAVVADFQILAGSGEGTAAAAYAAALSRGFCIRDECHDTSESILRMEVATCIARYRHAAAEAAEEEGASAEGCCCREILELLLRSDARRPAPRAAHAASEATLLLPDAATPADAAATTTDAAATTAAAAATTADAADSPAAARTEADVEEAARRFRSEAGLLLALKKRVAAIEDGAGKFYKVESLRGFLNVHSEPCATAPQAHTQSGPRSASSPPHACAYHASLLFSRVCACVLCCVCACVLCCVLRCCCCTGATPSAPTTWSAGWRTARSWRRRGRRASGCGTTGAAGRSDCMVSTSSCGRSTELV